MSTSTNRQKPSLPTSTRGPGGGAQPGLSGPSDVLENVAEGAEFYTEHFFDLITFTYTRRFIQQLMGTHDPKAGWGPLAGLSLMSLTALEIGNAYVLYYAGKKSYEWWQNRA